MKPRFSSPPRRRTRRSRLALPWLIAVAGLCALAPGSRAALVAQNPDFLDTPNFDARIAITGADARAVPAAANPALDDLRRAMPDVAATVDGLSGVTRTLYNAGGYLSDATAQDAVGIALDFARAQAGALGIDAGDVAGAEITDVTVNRTTGSTHVYLRQRVQGVPVYNGQLQVNVNRDGRVISVNNAFHPTPAVTAALTLPLIPADAAVRAAAAHLLLGTVGAARVAEAIGPERHTTVAAPEVSLQLVAASLMWLPVTRGDLRLVWNFQIHTLDGSHVYDMTVDAGTAQVMTRFDWTSSDQYRVYPHPAESPNHVAPAPPADGRSTVVDPSHPTASPFGWHDVNGAAGAEFTTMRGNNVRAYDDADNNNLPPAVEPDCGAALDCSFPVDLTAAPSAYRSAAIANLFYWNNIIHDIQYQYGFTEAAGNFQINNYGRGGLGNDGVLAEAQDGGGTNNANFTVTPDGVAPRMQMYVFNATVPNRDGDFDNGIIIHEYGHGISTRLVGGPANPSCLSNMQQPGEGLSDWWSLAYTQTSTGASARTRGMGTYVLGQPTAGAGIRAQRYSTDPAVNTWTYASISGMSIPHGVGSVWAQAAWEVYWALVDRHGFSSNLYDATGSAGNLRAMLYVNEGLMNAICRPAFTDVRDGIIQAAQDNHGGADVCTIWQAFAAFGLGADAISGGPNSTTPTNGFSLPASCQADAPQLSISDASVVEGQAGTAPASFLVTLSKPSTTQVSVRYATADVSARGGFGANTAAIAIPSSGGGIPYPSDVTIAAGLGPITGLTAHIHGFSHTWPSDVDVLLVGPTGLTVLLMSDVGNNAPVTDLTFTFDDSGPAMPEAALTAGTYRPTNVDTSSDTFPSPAPVGPYGTTLASFNGTDPTGTWRLFVRDDTTVDSGTILRGWSLTITTAITDYRGTSGTLVFPPGTTTQSVPVTINGDALSEPNETFTVTLSAAVDAVILDGQATGTIRTDDIFTDSSLHGIPIKVIHIVELRAAVNEARAAVGLAAAAFTDPALTAQASSIRAVHLVELRSAIAAVYVARGLPAPAFTDPTITPGVTTVRAAHVMELRSAVTNAPAALAPPP